ncbi:MAG: hypothetical protein ACYCYO_01620 [Bacilli bacterium]
MKMPYSDAIHIPLYIQLSLCVLTLVSIFGCILLFRIDRRLPIPDTRVKGGSGAQNRKMDLVWTLFISILAAVGTIVLWAYIGHHSSKTLSDAGILATIVGGIATAGGVVTALISLFSLNTVDATIQKSIEKEQALLDKKFKENINSFTRAFSAYNEAMSEDDLLLAERFMNKALNTLPYLPLAAEKMGIRFANSTLDFFRNQMHMQKAPLLRMQNFPSSSLFLGPLAKKEVDDGGVNYSLKSIEWLKRAKSDSEHTFKLDWFLARLYAICGYKDESIAALRETISTDSEFQHDEIVRDLGLLLWTAHTENDVSEVCKIIGYTPQLKLSADEFVQLRSGTPTTSVRILVVRRQGTAMELDIAPENPVICNIDQSTNEQGIGYQMRWPKRHEMIKIPEIHLPPFNEHELLESLNRWFIVIGRTDSDEF